MAIDGDRRDNLLTRAMGAAFGLGALCFAVAPMDAYGHAVGARADGLTFFVGSILFTLGGAVQCLLAAPERPDRPTGLAGWRTAWIQSVGTLVFNAMTWTALSVAATDRGYDVLVWAPNALGSACFLVSGAIFYLASPRRGMLPRRHHEGWWEPCVNLLGCVLFGVSAATGYALGHAGELVSASVANWTTALGAVCFLCCALAACGPGRTMKAPRLRRLRNLPHLVAEAAEREAAEIRSSLDVLADTLTEEIRTVD